MFSCEKEQLEKQVSEEEIITERLSFDNSSDFYEAMTRLSDTEDHDFEYEKDVKKWEESIGFVFMRRKYEELRQRFENLHSESAVAKFAKENASLITFSDGAYQIDPPMGLNLMNLLAVDGTIEIADALYKYTPDRIYIVLDKDEGKLEKVLQDQEEDLDNGVYIVSNWRKSELEFRSCNQTKKLDCTAPEISKKKGKRKLRSTACSRSYQLE